MVAKQHLQGLHTRTTAVLQPALVPDAPSGGPRKTLCRVVRDGCLYGASRGSRNGRAPAGRRTGMARLPAAPSKTRREFSARTLGTTPCRLDTRAAPVLLHAPWMGSWQHAVLSAQGRARLLWLAALRCCADGFIFSAKIRRKPSFSKNVCKGVSSPTPPCNKFSDWNYLFIGVPPTCY